MNVYKPTITILLLWFMSGCSGVDDLDVPPEWVFRLPSESGKIFAVGLSGPTYFVEDGLKYACDDARKELAKSVSSQIQNMIIVVEESNSSSTEEASVLLVNSAITDIVLKNSQIMAVWIDKKGYGPGSSKNYVYALGRMELTENEINNILKNDK
jgi:hypothetical protein